MLPVDTMFLHFAFKYTVPIMRLSSHSRAALMRLSGKIIICKYYFLVCRLYSHKAILHSSVFCIYFTVYCAIFSNCAVALCCVGYLCLRENMYKRLVIDFILLGIHYKINCIFNTEV